MMPILLSEEEMLRHWTLPEEISSTHYGVLEAISKAQVKKIVEWLDGKNCLKDEPWGEDYTEAYGYDPMVEDNVILSAKDWQVIKKEAGIT